LKITGSDAYDLNEHDHANCGASVLNEHWIITAAHCFTDKIEPRIYLLSGHNYTKTDNYKQIYYLKIFIHPKYEEFSGTQEFSTNDIALIQLNSRSCFRKNIGRPCLPRNNSIVPPNSICYITGFGATNNNDNEQIKRIREGRVAIKHDKICIKSLSLNYYDPQTMICAGKTRVNKANSCQGNHFEFS
jgi:secreted trypsin-like serine protease